MAETNEYELVRVKTEDGVLILYKNKIGTLNWPEELRKAYFAYKSGGKLNWRAAAKVKTRRTRSNVIIKTLWDRDGKGCWYCGIELSYDTSTIEHLFNVSHGGTNHIANLAVACNYCNQRAKNMCVTYKVKLRERLRVANKRG